MAIVPRLRNTESLRTTYLSRLATQRVPLWFYYDPDGDTLMLLLASPDRETIVHYLEDDVALLYTPDELEIVGLQVEDFEQEFVPKYNAVQKVWHLKDSHVLMGNVRDLTLATQGRTFQMALEVVKAAQAIIGEPARDLERALQHA